MDGPRVIDCASVAINYRPLVLNRCWGIADADCASGSARGLGEKVGGEITGISQCQSVHAPGAFRRRPVRPQTEAPNSHLSTVADALVYNCLVRSGQLSVLQPLLFLIGNCGVAAKINVHGQLPRKTLTKRSVRDGYNALQVFAMLYRIDGSQCLLKLAYAFQLLK